MEVEEQRRAELGNIRKRALTISLIAITSVFAFEFTAGIITNSLALTTDSIHALLDAFVTTILIIASILALRPRDIDHTYGHGKIETVGGFIGGTALFVVAIFFIYEAISRIAFAGSFPLVSPGVIGFTAVIYTLAVDGFRIAVLSWAMKKTTNTSNTSVTTIKADLYHAFADLASSSVVLAGLWFVTIGFGNGDSVAAIILGAFLAYLSIRFVYHNAMELTDVISPNLVARVRQAANDTEGVLGSDDIKMRCVGREIFVETTIALPAQISFENAHDISAKVESNISKILTSSGLEVDLKNITVHFEPKASMTYQAAESIIEKAASIIGGVKGVHNILVSKIAGTDSMEVSLHVQVNRSVTLTDAHSIADSVEDSIRDKLKGAETITVHLEPVMPEMSGIEPIIDYRIQDSIREIILAARDVKNVGKISTYKAAGDVLKIDVSCAFSRDMAIDQIHESVSDLEKEIRSSYPGSIVTIHAEPG